MMVEQVQEDTVVADMPVMSFGSVYGPPKVDLACFRNYLLGHDSLCGCGVAIYHPGLHPDSILFQAQPSNIALSASGMLVYLCRIQSHPRRPALSRHNSQACNSKKPKPKLARAAQPT